MGQLFGLPAQFWPFGSELPSCRHVVDGGVSHSLGVRSHELYMPSAGWAPPVDELELDEDVEDVDEVDEDVGPPLVLDVLLVLPPEVEDVLSVVSPPEEVEPEPSESVAVTPDALPDADSEPMESVPPSVSVPSEVPPWLEPAVVGTVVFALVNALVEESEPTAQPSSAPASKGRRGGSQGP